VSSGNRMTYGVQHILRDHLRNRHGESRAGASPFCRFVTTAKLDLS
jgi:hypothetical protein